MYVTDGGMETDLIFNHGAELPEFAAFPLVGSAAGWALLTRYYDGYAAIAVAAGAGLMLESATWRANPDWGARLGHPDLDAVNEAAIVMLHGLRERYAVDDVVVSGTVGPRGEGVMDPDEAAAYHAPQLAAFKRAGADLATAYTLTDVGEALGIARAGRAVGLPVAISFTVETDGRLAGGGSLGAAISTVDGDTPPDHFGVNCAHPAHIAPALGEPGGWRERVTCVRANASTMSHAELDEATALDDADPALFAAAFAPLRQAFPQLSIVGGCCGTDARHVAALWAVGQG